MEKYIGKLKQLEEAQFEMAHMTVFSDGSGSVKYYNGHENIELFSFSNLKEADEKIEYHLTN